MPRIRFIQHAVEYVELDVEETLDWQDDPDDYDTLIERVSALPETAWTSDVNSVDIIKID